jgi:prephenate dehydrogenase
MSSEAGAESANLSGGRAPERILLRRVAIIGLGLMGGSLALALRRAGVAAQIVGCGRQVLIDRAREMGALDSGSTDACEVVAGSDCVVLCTPVETSIALMKQIAPHLAPGAVITDVGSTKQSFAAAACELFGAEAAQRVLPGHPLAGRELSGLEHATADLYDGCVWVLTPLGQCAKTEGNATDQPELTAAQRALRLALEAIGARVVLTSAAEHDRVLAYTSHLPQMLSTALALTLAENFAAADPALEIHGGGLRTMLRLAGSEPKMWEQIAASNHENIAQALEHMEAALRQLRESLGAPEFRAKFEQAREFAKFLKG